MVRGVGEVLVQVKVHGPGGSAFLDDVLVDTGAIHSVIDRVIAERLRIVAEARAEFEIIGGTVELPLATAVLELDGRGFRVPVILGDQNLVGLTTLETLGFAVDPTTRGPHREARNPVPRASGGGHSGFADVDAVGSRVHQVLRLLRVRDLEDNEPSVAVRLCVHKLRVVLERLVQLNDLP